ncbi:Protein PRY2 [Cladobotryum mycophilum]|uniref:Protein PRY2 n=1 Tax=Cladobotryum mycophilum TaxID=491253 RepID=A0ABR0SRG0_9HYPO
MKTLLLHSLSLLSLLFLPSTAVIVTVTAPPSIPSSEPSYSNLQTFTSAILNSTNVYRDQHNASSLRWNQTLASFASTYLSSPSVGDACKFEHSGGPYGENLAIGYPNATASVEAWGNEREKYNFNDPGFSHETGHFTQLVWKDTTDVGCDRKLCGTKGWYLICEYWPRGNVGGRYGEEVDRQVSGAGSSRRSSTTALVMVALACVLLQVCC